MVKILICGYPVNNWQILLDRVDSLNKSAHGPFHVLLVCGAAFTSPSDLMALQNNAAPNEGTFKLPIPTYVYDFKGRIDEYKALDLENLHFLQDNCYPKGSHKIGMCTLGDWNLTVAFALDDTIPSPSDDTNDISREINEICIARGYRGCDILLSSVWPKDTHQFLGDADFQTIQGLASSHGIYGGSKAIGEWANVIKPRYHVTSEYGFFYQRPPYRNPLMVSKGGEVGKQTIYTRFISLGHVSNSKDKEKKWLHALSLEPIILMPQGAKEFLSDEPPAATTDNPYVSVGRAIDDAAPSTKRPKFEDTSNNRSGGGSFFFGTMGVSSNISGSNDGSRSNIVLVAPSADAKRLFIGGLARDVSDAEMLSTFSGSLSVIRQPGKSFAFIEFANHADAVKIINQSARRGYSIRNKNVTVGWASSSDAMTLDSSSSTDNSIKSLFVGGLPGSFNDNELLDRLPGSIAVRRVQGKDFAFVDFETRDIAERTLSETKDYPVHLRDQKLSFGWAKANNNISVNLNQPSSEAKTLFVGGLSSSSSVQDIQELFSAAESIRRPDGKDFAFVEFKSPDQARDIIDGGFDYSLHGKTLVIGWAQGKPAERSSVSSHAGNCWFCLASPTVAMHLIVSVGESVYLALPKGGVVDSHVLIIPIDCIPSRIHLSASAKVEFQSYENALKKMYYSSHQGLLIYERAIRTKGRDHMQEHVIPIPYQLISNALKIFEQVAKDYKLKFHEIEDREADEVALSMEGGPYQEYFYISVPFIEGKDISSKRYLYVHDDRARQFPMFFGNEVSAKVIGKPERANWKNCVVSEQQENHLVELFRDSFEKYDFTLSN